ncbi:MAG: AsmA family protein [Devosiaceae bacterium]
MIRRIFLGLIFLALCLTGLAFALPFAMSSQMVREQVASQISQLTGRAVTLRGDQALQVFPNLSVELSDVVIEGDIPGIENALIVTETLRGAVRALPLLFGRIEMSSFELTRPTIRLQRNEDGQSNWQLQGSDLVSALEPSQLPGRGLELGTFRITDGTLHYVDAPAGITETISSADLTLSWPTSSTRAAINGAGIWRGEEVELSASLDQPAALAQPGSTSGVVLSVAGAPLQLRFDGTVSPGRNGENLAPWQASGSLAVSTPSLRRAASWLTSEVGAGSTFGAFRLDADMNLVGATMDLTDLQISLDGNEAEGVLTLDLDGHHNGETSSDRPSMQGTLDFERLDLSAYLDTIRTTTTAQAPGDWRFLPIPDPQAISFDLDLRFASREVLASSVTLSDTAGSILLNDQRFVLGIGEAIGYGGAVRGSLTLDTSQDVAELALDASAEAIEIGTFLDMFQDRPAIDGTLSFQSLLTGEGETLAQVLATLAGDASLSLNEGIMRGINLDEMAESFVEGTFDFANFSPQGETAFEQVSTELYARDGFIQLRDVMLATQRVSVTMGGQSELVNRTLNFSGATAISTNDQTLIVPFDVRGTWSAPIILPDLTQLQPADESN